jgi:hypothetical protein
MEQLPALAELAIVTDESLDTACKVIETASQ